MFLKMLFTTESWCWPRTKSFIAINVTKCISSLYGVIHVWSWAPSAMCKDRSSVFPLVSLHVVFGGFKVLVKPSSYFLRMRSEFVVNLMSQLRFHSECWAQLRTVANKLLRICAVKIRITFAWSMNRALESHKMLSVSIKHGELAVE